MSVHRALNNQLIISMNRLTPIYLKDVLSYIAQQKLEIMLILNFTEPYLEGLAISMVRKWQLEKKVCYTGDMMPDYLTTRERKLIHYDVTNCLPNYYHLSTIKRSHFDVIHYFMRKNKVDTLRMHESGLTENILNWANELEIMLSIYGVSTAEQVKELLASGIVFVSASAEKMFGNVLQEI